MTRGIRLIWLQVQPNDAIVDGVLHCPPFAVEETQGNVAHGAQAMQFMQLSFGQNAGLQHDRTRLRGADANHGQIGACGKFQGIGDIAILEQGIPDQFAGHNPGRRQQPGSRPKVCAMRMVKSAP